MNQQSADNNNTAQPPAATAEQKISTAHSDEFDKLTIDFVHKVLNTDYPAEEIDSKPCNWYKLRACIWHIIQIRMKAQGREWKSDQHNRHVIQQLVGWMLNAPVGSQKQTKNGKITFTLDPFKGILLQGYTGVGKTFILELIAISAAWFGIRRLKGVSKNICNEAAQCSSENNTKRIMRMKNGNLYIDDIGSEKDMNIFGEKVSALEEILKLRKEAYSKRRKITCGTTNIPFWAYAYGDENQKDPLPIELRSPENLRKVKTNPLEDRDRTAFRTIFQPITLEGDAKV